MATSDWGGLAKGRDGPATFQQLLTTTMIGKAFLVALYLCLNVSLNLVNKWIISHYGFQFPILLSIAHMGFGVLALSPLMALSKQYRDSHGHTLQKQWAGLLCIGAAFAMNVGMTNASLLTLSLSLQQVIRAGIPVVTACAAVFIEQRTPSRQEFIALSVLVLGVAIAVYDPSASQGTFGGVTLCLIGTVCNGVMVASIGKLLSEKVDVLRLVWYTSPVALCLLLPFHWRLEADRYAAYTAKNGSMYVGVLLLGCVNALAYNLIHSLVVQVTSSVTTVVVGEMKIVVILLLSAVLLGEANVWTLKMMVGCTTAILGFCMYSHSRLLAGSPQFQPIIKGMPELTVSVPSLGGALGDSLNMVRVPLLSTRDAAKARG